MRKDCYVSSVNLLDKCAYSYLIIEVGDNGAQKIAEAKAGEFYLRKPNKTCMFVTDLIVKKHPEITFHFDTPEAYDYVTGMRDIKANYPVRSIKNEYQELNKQLLKEFVKSKYKSSLPLVEMQMKERE